MATTKTSSKIELSNTTRSPRLHFCFTFIPCGLRAFSFEVVDPLAQMAAVTQQPETPAKRERGLKTVGVGGDRVEAGGAVMVDLEEKLRALRIDQPKLADAGPMIGWRQPPRILRRRAVADNLDHQIRAPSISTYRPASCEAFATSRTRCCWIAS